MIFKIERIDITENDEEREWLAKQKFKKVESGIFGADMKVELINDGPFTLILEDGNGL